MDPLGLGNLAVIERCPVYSTQLNCTLWSLFEVSNLTVIERCPVYAG